MAQGEALAVALAVEVTITSGERAEGLRRVFRTAFLVIRKAFLASARGMPRDAPAERAVPCLQQTPGFGELCCTLPQLP